MPRSVVPFPVQLDPLCGRVNNVEIKYFVAGDFGANAPKSAHTFFHSPHGKFLVTVSLHSPSTHGHILKCMTVTEEFEGDGK